MVANYAAIGFGQLFLLVYGARGFVAFSLATMLVMLAIVPVCLTRQVVPAQETISRRTLRQPVVAAPPRIVACFGWGGRLGQRVAPWRTYGAPSGSGGGRG